MKGIRSQISIFLIIVAVALVTFLFILTFSAFNAQRERDNAQRMSSQILSTQADSLKEYVTRCLYDTSLPAVYYVGLTGGYIDMPKQALITDKTFIAYYYYNGADTSPDIKTVETEISNYVEETLFLCLDDFRAFREKGVDIEPGKMEVTTEIGESDVWINLNYPIKVKQGKSSIMLKDFLIYIPVRLGINYGYAQIVTQEILSKGGIAPPEVFDSFDVNSIIMRYDGKRTVYLFRDEKAEEEPSLYFFAAKET